MCLQRAHSNYANMQKHSIVLYTVFTGLPQYVKMPQ